MTETVAIECCLTLDSAGYHRAAATNVRITVEIGRPEMFDPPVVSRLSHPEASSI
jgi:hypothetical protein